MSSSKVREERARALAGVRRYLRSSVRSTAEVRTYLRRRGVSAATAADVIAECRRLDWLDDRASARLWAEQWARAGYATAAVQEKLRAKTFNDTTISHALHTIEASESDEARARRVVSRYQRPTPQARARVARTLASRGFDADVIERVLNDTFGSTPSDAE